MGLAEQIARANAGAGARLTGRKPRPKAFKPIVRPAKKLGGPSTALRNVGTNTDSTRLAADRSSYAAGKANADKIKRGTIGKPLSDRTLSKEKKLRDQRAREARRGVSNAAPAATKRIKRKSVGGMLGGAAAKGLKRTNRSTKTIVRRGSGGGSAPSGGGGGGGGGSAPSGGGGGGKTTSGPKTTTAPTAPPVPDVTDPSVTGTEFDDLFATPTAELARQEQNALNTRNLQIGDSTNLRDWLAAQQAEAEKYLGTQLAASRAAQVAPSGYLAEAQATNTDTVNADTASTAGLDASRAANNGYAAVNNAARMAPEMNAQAFTRGLADQRAVMGANVTNLQGNINGAYNKRLSDIMGQRSKLATDAITLGLQNQQAEAKNAMDERNFRLLATEKLGNLEVAKVNAQTKRLQVLTTARNAREANNLKAAIAKGQLTIQEARLKLKAELDSQNLSVAKKRLELARFDSETKRLTADSGAQQKMLKWVGDKYDNYLKQFGASGFDSIPESSKRSVVRNVITGLKAQGGNRLTQAQAITMLGSVFGSIPLRDPAFRQMVTSLWPA